MIFSVVVGLVLFLTQGGWFESFPFLFMLPWIGALVVALSIPVIITTFKRDEEFDNPLIIATGTYFFPAFVVGGLSLSLGLSDPYYISYIQDIETTLPFTILMIILGFTGLALGYYLPFGKNLGAKVGTYLPDGASKELRPYMISGIVLVVIGMVASGNAAVAGVIGYQKADSIGIFDGIIYLSTLFLAQGSFILWFCIFRKEQRGAREWAIVGLLLSIIVANALIAGNRGSLLSSTIAVILAYLLSGKRLTVKLAAIVVAVFFTAITLGMIYGTTFRETKGSEQKVDIGTYVDSIGKTIDQIGTRDNIATLEYGLMNLAQRLDTVSSLAVVVSSYEQLAPYEEGYGLDNNIWKDMSSFFIPRVFWADKPVASDPRRYSELYFNFGENSFAITPIGDLIRNYGVWGVFLGMLLLGMILRTIYTALIDGKLTVWKSALYFMLLSAVSYEGFYGTIIPMLFKTGFTAIVGLLIVEFVAKKVAGRGSKDLAVVTPR